MKWPANISIQHVALAFITALLVLVSLIGGLSAYQTRAVSRSLEAHNQNAARSELVAAVERLLNQTKEQAVTLAQWDETRQQLVLPEYYAYWRDQRVYESGMLNRSLARAELYRLSGELLVPSPEKSPLPARLQSNLSALEPTNWLTSEAGAIALYCSAPVYGEIQRQTLLVHSLIGDATPRRSRNCTRCSP